jgi:DNA-binding LacI/PurR family transcriptional regulator
MEALPMHWKRSHTIMSHVPRRDPRSLSRQTGPDGHPDGAANHVRPQRPTLDEVARLAGVSRATASRVLNGSPLASGEARAAVDQAIARLGYVPNRAARSLVTRRTDTIALVVSEPESRVFSDPFFRTTVQGVTAALGDTDLQLLLLLAQGPREHDKVERYLRQGHVDGVILLSLHGDDPLPQALSAAGIPTVLAGRPRPGEPLAWVDADNRGGARAATELLLSSGRRRPATITGRLDMTAAEDRLQGCADALAAAGMRLPKGMIAPGDFTEAGGHRAMAGLLRRHPDIDAVFAASDLMAIGALRALADAGRRVPDDVAVVGFDDIAEARLAQPPLTTVRQPLEQMTRAVTDLLLRVIEGSAGDGEHVVCPTQIVRRRSA